MENPLTRRMGAKGAFPVHRARGSKEGLEMPIARGHLLLARPIDGRAHLGGDGLGHVFGPLQIGRENTLQRVDPFGHGGGGPPVEGAARGGDGGIGIGLIAQRDGGADLFGRGIDHRQIARAGRGDPTPVDVEMAAMVHGHLPCTSATCHPRQHASRRQGDTGANANDFLTGAKGRNTRPERCAAAECLAGFWNDSRFS